MEGSFSCQSSHYPGKSTISMLYVPRIGASQFLVLSLPVLLFSHVVLYFFTFFSIKSLFWVFGWWADQANSHPVVCIVMQL